MGVLNSSRKAMKGFIEKSYSMGQLHGEMKKINDPRRQNLIETVHLTKAEENKIDTLFVSTYGKKIMAKRLNMIGIGCINLLQENLMKTIFLNIFFQVC